MLILHDEMESPNNHWPPHQEHSQNKATSRECFSQLPATVQTLSIAHRSASPKQCPKWAVLLLIALAIASADSVALPPSQTDTSLSSSSLPISSSSSSSFDSVLSLNSSVQHTKEDLHEILAPLTDEIDDDAEEGWPESIRRKRAANEQQGQNDYCHRISKRAIRNKENSKWCSDAIHICGGIFINAYNFAEKGHNNKDDILVAQCVLRNAFFDCLKEKSNCEKKSKNSRPKRADDKSDKHQKFKIGRKLNPREKREKRFRNCLADTIWESRLCIFKTSIVPL